MGFGYIRDLNLNRPPLLLVPERWPHPYKTNMEFCLQDVVIFLSPSSSAGFVPARRCHFPLPLILCRFRPSPPSTFRHFSRRKTRQKSACAGTAPSTHVWTNHAACEVISPSPAYRGSARRGPPQFRRRRHQPRLCRGLRSQRLALRGVLSIGGLGKKCGDGL